MPATWNVYYEVHIQNTSGALCSNVVITDTKDARTYYISSAPAAQQVDPHTFVWHIGTLGPGEHRSVQLVVSTGPSLAGQTVHNHATVDCDQGAPFSVVRDTRIGPVPVTPTPTRPPTATSSPTLMPTQTAMPTATPIPTATAIGHVHLRVMPFVSTLTCSGPFEKEVVVEAGRQPVAIAEVYLDFDPARLEVVSIGDGAGLWVWSKTFDNALGRIDVRAGSLGPPPQGTFTLVTLYLRAKECSASTATGITHSFAGFRRTLVKDEISRDVLEQAHDGVVYLNAPTHWLYLPLVLF